MFSVLFPTLHVFFTCVLCRIYKAMLQMPVTRCLMAAQGGRQEQAAPTAPSQHFTSHCSTDFSLVTRAHFLPRISLKIVVTLRRNHQSSCSEHECQTASFFTKRQRAITNH